MFWHVGLLCLSWLFIFLAERVFPRVQTALNMSSHWSSYFFFKPVHLLFSSLFFITALLMIRHITRFHFGILLGHRGAFKQKNIYSWIPLLFGFGILLFTLNRHLTPTLLVTGVFFIADVNQAYREFRRKRRLKSVFHSFPKSTK